MSNTDVRISDQDIDTEFATSSGGTRLQDADTTDGDATDATDGDAADGDATDATDGDATDAADADGTDV